LNAAGVDVADDCNRRLRPETVIDHAQSIRRNQQFSYRPTK
jgi:hypothetical protein